MQTKHKIKEIISLNVKGRRQQLDISQTGLANLLGKSRSWVSSVEVSRSSVHAEDLPSLAAHLQCTVTDLFFSERFYRESSN